MPNKPKKSKNLKKIDTSQSEATLRNKVDALFQLVTRQGERLDNIEKDVKIINTDYSFHRHDIVLRTGPKFFSRELAEQWQREQDAKNPPTSPPEKQPPKE